MREQKCPNCGGNEIVFDNGRYKCTFCGTVFTDKTADKATYKYASRISQATEHLKIGNYDRAYSIAKELEDLHPTDSNPYAIILLSLTSKLSDYHLEEGKRQEASDVWDKMEQLNTVAQPMIDYAEIMYRKKNEYVKSCFYQRCSVYRIWNYHAYKCFSKVSWLVKVICYTGHSLFCLLLLAEPYLRKC